MRARFMTLPLCLVAAPTFAVPVPAEVPDLVVDCRGVAGYTTIQSAIDAAVSGDRIGVAPCVYVERIEFGGKRLDVYGVMGSLQTVIDGDGDGTVVKIRDAEAEGTRLAGFTLRNGQDDDDGSAIEIRDATVELEDLVMTGNLESKSVLFAQGAFVTAIDVVVRGNDVDPEGQAIWSDGGSLVARGLDVDCDGGHEALYHHNPLILDRSTISCNGGDGLYDYHGEDRIGRSTITGGGRGIYAHDTESTYDAPDNPTERLVLRNVVVEGGDVGIDVLYMTPDLRNVVVVGDDSALMLTACQSTSTASATAFVGAACGITSDQPFSATSSAFWQNARNGCGTPVGAAVTTDPRFESAADYHLRPGSPLIDAGPSGATYQDTNGTRNDIGAYGGPGGEW